MIKKLCLFILLVIFSNSVLAEYYLVYTPPQCVDCVGAAPPPVDYYCTRHPCHKARHYKRIKHVNCRAKYKPRAIVVYRQINTCGACENCIYGDGYAISTSQPEFYGEHCTSYEDVMRGEEYAGY